MRTASISILLAAVALVATAWSAAAAAPEATARIIVVQSAVGTRAPSAGANAVLLDDLEVHGFAAHPETVVRQLSGRVPRPGVVDESLTPASIAQAVDDGYDLFTHGKFSAAEAMLRVSLEQIHRNPGLLVIDTTNANMMFKALVGIALSEAHQANGAARSTDTMIELIRTFGTQPVSRAEYGPEAEQLYRAASKQIQSLKSGGLYVRVKSDKAVVFVDGQIRGIGKASLANLVPGTYRVFVQVPGTVGRQYEVEVKANEDSKLDVAWDVDSSLWVSDASIGLVFATEAERGSKEGAFASSLARRWGGAQQLAVIGVTQLQGKPATIGTLYFANGEIARSGVVILDGNDTRKLESLAQFLTDGTKRDGVNVVSIGPKRGTPPAQPAPASPQKGAPNDDSIVSLVPVVSFGAGVGAIGIGAYATLLTNGRKFGEPVEGPEKYSQRNLGVGLIAGGVVAVAATLYYWHRTSRPASMPMLSLARDGASVGWATTF